MSEWVTHLTVADRVLERFPGLAAREFCVGNIAPDCNVENEDWTSFTPPREVTHWMTDGKKRISDCGRFYAEVVESRRREHRSNEELSVLLGYYAHLVTDAEFQRTVRDPDRVRAVWERIKAHPVLGPESAGMPETWDSVKRLIGRQDRLRDIGALEREYLDGHPDSGYFKYILKLSDFPDYLDILPHGAIPRKVGVMAHIPDREPGRYPYIGMSKEEYFTFLDNTVRLLTLALSEQ